MERPNCLKLVVPGTPVNSHAKVKTATWLSKLEMIMYYQNNILDKVYIIMKKIPYDVIKKGKKVTREVIKDF